MRTSDRLRCVVTIVAILFVGLAATVATPAVGAEQKPAALEPDAPGKLLVEMANSGPEAALRDKAGLSPEAVKRIMAHRAAGRKFKDVEEVCEVAGIPAADMPDILKNVSAAQAAGAGNHPPASQTPSPSKAGRLSKDPTGEAPTPATGGSGAPGSDNAGPIGAVRPGFYAKLPGFENLDKIDPLQRTEFLETVNREMCSCGCAGHTVAYCLVNDPGCPTVKQRAKKIYDDIVNRPSR